MAEILGIFKKFFLYIMLPIMMLLLLSSSEAEESTMQLARKARLVGWAMLPADTFSKGPTSGRFLKPTNRRNPPFVNQQPVQGFSAILQDQDGRFLAMSDNGFGMAANSSDYILRVYRIYPDFRTANGGSGRIKLHSFFSLKDTDRKIDFPIVADHKIYPKGKSGLPVDPRIRSNRLLTGADFDIESFCRISDGTFYFGDEFGPYLLHTDGLGKLLEPPIALPGVHSPDFHSQTKKVNLSRSRGFEGMGFDPESKRLFPMLEGSLKGQEGQLNIYSFDLTLGKFGHTDPFKPLYKYRLHSSAESIGDFIMLSKTIGLIIERDNKQGVFARFKKIYRVDLTKTDEDGFLRKTVVADLLQIADPYDISKTGLDVFTFPFWTIEGMVMLDKKTIGIINDNNYPNSIGRHALTSGEPDDTEFILLYIDNLY